MPKLDILSVLYMTLKQSDGEVPVMSGVPLHCHRSPGLFWLGVVAPDRVLSTGKNRINSLTELFENKLLLYAQLNCFEIETIYV